MTSRLNMFGILEKDHSVRTVPTIVDSWLKDFKDRIVERTVFFEGTKEQILVSTVFLGINHGFGGKPLWFETMIFGNRWEHKEYQSRYETWDEAILGHKMAVDLVQEELKKK